MSPTMVDGEVTSLRRAFHKKIGTALLILIVLFGALLRVYGLGTDDYWFDELYSLSVSAGKRADFATQPYGRIVHEYGLSTEIDDTSTIKAVTRALRDVDTHPPVYFLLLRTWRIWFGEGEFTVRSLSATISILSIVTFWLIFAAIGRFRAGLFAAALTALAFPHVYIAQENRQYSLSVLMSVLSFLLLVLGQRYWHGGVSKSTAGFTDRQGRLGKLGLLVAAGYACTLYLSVLTHYFSGLVLIGQSVYAIARLRGRALAYWTAAVLTAAGAAAVTWLDAFLDQVDVIQSQRWLIDPVPNHAMVSVLRFLDLPIRLFIWVEPYKSYAARSLIAVLFIVVIALVLHRKRDKHAFLFAMWFLAPAVFMFIVDLVTGKQLLYPLRFPVIAAPGLIGLVALAIDGLGRSNSQTGRHLRAARRPDGVNPGEADENRGSNEKGGRAPLGHGFAADSGSRLAPIVALGALLVVMAVRLPLPATDHPHARRAVQQLRERISDGDLIIYDGVGWPPDWVPQFFAPMDYYSQDLKNPFMLLRDPMTEELRTEVAAYERVFVVSPRIDAVPDPSPLTHRLAGRSAYFHQIGWIYLFVKKQANGL